MKPNEKYVEVDDSWCPTFIGIGPMKGASTWLYQCLREHPEISVSTKKEVHYYDVDQSYSKGHEFYKKFFVADGGIAGELTPTYLYEPLVPGRIYTDFPQVKLIACLRNPADRAWSHYRFSKQMHGRISAYSSFMEAYVSDRALSGMGRYGEQLERYYKYFSKGQVMVLFFEDIVSNPVETVQEVYRFIGTKNSSYVPEAATKAKNKTGDRKMRIKYQRSWMLLVKARKLLHEYPRLEELFKRLGLILKVKKFMRDNVSVDMVTEAPSIQPKMTKEDRQLVIDDVKEDIVKLELITGRNLTSWKTIAE